MVAASLSIKIFPELPGLLQLSRKASPGKRDFPEDQAISGSCREFKHFENTFEECSFVHGCLSLDFVISQALCSPRRKLAQRAIFQSDEQRTLFYNSKCFVMDLKWPPLINTESKQGATRHVLTENSLQFYVK
ncbi:hypothetical protein CDAR_440161 [Caerostris darwini]|uniref:Uncharacterized protein n=1 Tax=Caerostris darwini TaxID=1538125 RepID=A0AAV4RJ03_9ARAC|nr:hypothetical protein CDAR_440161 [Caerostris darwini]